MPLKGTRIEGHPRCFNEGIGRELEIPRGHGFRVLAYQSSGLPHGSHTRLQIVPYTAAMEVLS